MKKTLKGEWVRLDAVITRNIVKNGMVDVIITGSESKNGVRIELSKCLRKHLLWWK
jgi:deoxyhypusine synthase